MKYRTCEKFVQDEWVPIEFDDIKKGDHIKLWEQEAVLVSEFIAETDATPCQPPGNWGVSVDTVIHKD